MSSKQIYLPHRRNICLWLSSDRNWRKIKWPEGRIIVGFRGGEGRTQAEARALQVHAGHWLTLCYVSRWTEQDMDISPKEDLIAWLEFEIAYYSGTVQHYAMGTTSI